MSYQSSPSIAETHPELNTASVSAGVFVGVILLHFVVKSLSIYTLASGLFLVSMISLGAFTLSMVNLILDERQVFTTLIQSYNVSMYSLQLSVVLLIGLGVFAVAQTPSFNQSSHLFAVTVVYLTMVGVFVWFAQEAMTIHQ